MPKKRLKIPPQQIGDFSQSALTVTLKKPNDLVKVLPKQDYNDFKKTYKLAESSPKKARKKAYELYNRFPEIEEILNLLTYIYFQTKQNFKAERLIAKHYELHPNSILAMTHFADLCIRKKKLKKIPQIFSNTYDLATLFPNTKEFHLTEYRAFLNTMGHYHLAIRKKEIASYYHLLSYKVDPNFPATKLLGKMLYKPSFRERLKGMFLRKKSIPQPAAG